LSYNFWFSHLHEEVTSLTLSNASRFPSTLSEIVQKWLENLSLIRLITFSPTPPQFNAGLNLFAEAVENNQELSQFPVTLTTMHNSGAVTHVQVDVDEGKMIVLYEDRPKWLL